jgi:hypothetical protein
LHSSGLQAETALTTSEQQSKLEDKGLSAQMAAEADAQEDSSSSSEDVLGPVPGVDVMAKRPQGLLNVGTLSARMAVLRSCALDI